MSRVRSQTLTRLERRVCLSCGYRGREIQKSAPVEVFACPACGADLYARPARSYAEMEGLETEAGLVGAGARQEWEWTGRGKRERAGWMWRLGRLLRRMALRR